jgi:hypothetical protein
MKSDDETVQVDDVDQLVSKVESFVVEEYRSGRVTAHAGEWLERALSAVRKQKP